MAEHIPLKEWIPALQPYAVLLRLVVDGSLNAAEFEVIFLRLYLQDPTEWPPHIFEVLQDLFAGVDDFVADDSLRTGAGGIDESQLRRRAEKTLERLKATPGTTRDP